jgi:hypothetical protein
MGGGKALHRVRVHYPGTRQPAREKTTQPDGSGLRRLTAHKIGEIFGVRVTKKLKGKLHTTLERIEHGHHIFRAYFKHAFVKQYDPLRLCQETVWK